MCHIATMNLNACFLRLLFALLSLVWTNELAGYTCKLPCIFFFFRHAVPFQKFSSFADGIQQCPLRHASTTSMSSLCSELTLQCHVFVSLFRRLTSPSHVLLFVQQDRRIHYSIIEVIFMFRISISWLYQLPDKLGWQI